MSTWTTRSDAVLRAAEDSEIAHVLERADAIFLATTTGDIALFASGHAPECVVNSPANRVISGAQAEAAFAAGMIDYAAADRVIDHVAKLPGGMIVVMGEEILRPRGRSQDAGKRVRRRFTDLWRAVDGVWKISVRQATIIAVEPLCDS